MTTYKPLGVSVYCSEFENQKSFLEQFAHEQRLVFTSLHIPEEISEGYVDKIKDMVAWLNQKGFRIIGDLSKRTLEVFGVKSILELAQVLNLYMLRIDYGFSLEEMLEAAASYPLAFNASTVCLEDALELKKIAPQIVGIHNFYPREYTGLSLEQFHTINKKLKQHGIEVIAFISHSEKSRGPVYNGLPTIEKQRYQDGYINYLEMVHDETVDGIILADLGLEPTTIDWLKKFEKTQVITLPVAFKAPFSHLNHQTYTIRIDSPDCLLRLQESRAFATPGQIIEPFNTCPRTRGSITCDNKNYGRYSGELQILKTPLPQDTRVNVIGTVHEKYQQLVDFIPNGYKIIFEPR